MPNEIKGFISYAHEDEAYRQIFKENLQKLVSEWSDTKINLWTDEQLIIGTKWQQEIIQKIEQSDFAIFLVSDYFCSSNFIQKVELKKFLDRDTYGASRLFPIKIRETNEALLKNSKLDKYQLYSSSKEEEITDLYNEDSSNNLEPIDKNKIYQYFHKLVKSYIPFLDTIINGTDVGQRFISNTEGFIACFEMDIYNKGIKCTEKMQKECNLDPNAQCKQGDTCQDYENFLEHRSKFIRVHFKEILNRYFNNSSDLHIHETTQGFIIGFDIERMKHVGNNTENDVGWLLIGFAFKLLKAIKEHKFFDCHLIEIETANVKDDNSFKKYLAKIGLHYGEFKSIGKFNNSLAGNDVNTVQHLANIALEYQILFSKSFLGKLPTMILKKTGPNLKIPNDSNYFRIVDNKKYERLIKKFDIRDPVICSDNEKINIRKMPKTYDLNNRELIAYSTYISPIENPNIAIYGNSNEIPENISIHMRSSTPLISSESYDLPIENVSFREFLDQIGNYKEIISIGITHENWLYFFIKTLEKKYFSKHPQYIYDFDERIIKPLKNRYNYLEKRIKGNKNSHQILKISHQMSEIEKKIRYIRIAYRKIEFSKRREKGLNRVVANVKNKDMIDGIKKIIEDDIIAYNSYYDILSMLKYDFPWEKFTAVFLDKSLFPFFNEGRTLADRLKGANKGENLLRIIINNANKLDANIGKLLTLTSNLPFVGTRFSKPIDGKDGKHPEQCLRISLMITEIETWQTPSFMLYNPESQLFQSYNKLYNNIMDKKMKTGDSDKNTQENTESFEEMHLLGINKDDFFVPRGYALRSEKKRAIEHFSHYFRPVVLVVFYLKEQGVIKPVLQIRTSVNSDEDNNTFSNLSGNVEYIDLINLRRKESIEKNVKIKNTDEKDKRLFWLKNYRTLFYETEDKKNYFYNLKKRTFNRASMDAEILNEMWRNAAIREIEEEFGIIDLTVPEGEKLELKPVSVPTGHKDKGGEEIKKQFLTVEKGKLKLMFRIYKCKITKDLITKINQEREWANIFCVNIEEIESHHKKVKKKEGNPCRLNNNFKLSLEEQIEAYKGQEEIRSISNKNLKQKDEDYFKKVNEFHYDILEKDIGINNLLKNKFDVFKRHIWIDDN